MPTIGSLEEKKKKRPITPKISLYLKLRCCKTYGHPPSHSHILRAVSISLLWSSDKGQPIQGFLNPPVCMAHVSCMVLTWCSQLLYMIWVGHLFKTRDIAFIWLQGHRMQNMALYEEEMRLSHKAPRIWSASVSHNRETALDLQAIMTQSVCWDRSLSHYCSHHQRALTPIRLFCTHSPSLTCTRSLSSLNTTVLNLKLAASQQNLHVLLL